jgi:hypothetical protein
VCVAVRSSGQSVQMLRYDNMGLFAFRLLDAAKFSTLFLLLHFSCTLSPQTVSWAKISILATKDFVLLTVQIPALVPHGN